MPTFETSRRTLLAGLAGALGVQPAGLGAADQPTRPQVRRLVTADGPDGRARLLFSDTLLPEVSLNGSRITRLWETDGVPVRLPITADRGATAGNAYREGFAGTSLYVADLPPGGQAPVIPMHREDSLDYIAVLAGKVWLLLEGEEHLLRQGDVLVQAGNLHTWANRGSTLCRLLVVVLRARR